MDDNIIQSIGLIKKKLEETKDPAYRAQWIITCAEQHFPPLVIAEVKKLLRISSKNDISRALLTLYDLRDEGVKAVWSQIKSKLTVEAHRVCGTIFPEERIEEGQTTPLDIACLGEFLANEIKRLDQTTVMDRQISEAIVLSTAAKNNLARDRTTVTDYLLRYPVLKAESVDAAILEPTVGEHLMALSEKIDQLMQNTSKFLSLLGEEEPLRAPSYAGLFTKKELTLGCEPPEGSVIDDMGLTVVPVKKSA